MKKFCVILFMSCLLNFVPMAFGAATPLPEMTLFSTENHGYCWQVNTAKHINPLNSLVSHENDQFINTLDKITEDAQKGVNLSSLPAFSLYLDTQSQNTITLLNPLNPTEAKKDVFSPILNQLFKLESAQNGVVLLDHDRKPIAILRPEYNPNNPEATIPTKVLPNIINTNIKNEKKTTNLEKKSSSITLPKIAFLGSLLVIVAGGALYYNKILPSSMEAVVDHLLSSCQGMFSRISSHTNNLRA
jgi:hypothetical protein